MLAALVEDLGLVPNVLAPVGSSHAQAPHMYIDADTQRHKVKINFKK